MTRIRILAGAEVAPHLEDLARLRIAVFRDFPYLYDGDADYERGYLATYARNPGSVFVLALDGDAVVGAATGLPMAGEPETVRGPWLQAGVDPASVFYFGESVLLPRWRGQGIGHAFFDAREAHARALGGFSLTCFCAVERPADHPLRPPGWRQLDGFWSARGYARQPQLACTMRWREVGQAAESDHRLVFWSRPLH